MVTVFAKSDVLTTDESCRYCGVRILDLYMLNKYSIV